ncbi:hypothetical protein NMG60_11036862 [Bertholletia excelsa]
MAAENWACLNGIGEDFDKLEVPGIDSSLLKSLLEESQADECDDERLNSVIRSLEAEIDPNAMSVSDSSMDGEWVVSNSDDCQSSDLYQHMDDQDYSMAHDLDHFNWMEVEMAPSLPCDELNNWYLEPCEVEVNEYGGVTVRDHSHMYHYGVPSEEDAYGSLWQEACPPMING